MFIQKIKTNKIILLLLCGIVNLSFAQNTFDSIACGENLQYKSVEKLQEIEKLNQLPIVNRKKIIHHLKKYLGKDFFNLLVFEKGTIYKSESFNKLDKDFKEYPKLKPVYELYFSISAVKSGIRFYCSRVTFNSNGRVVHPISFPKKGVKFSTANFIDKEKLIYTADSLGYLTENYVMAISNTGHFVLVFHGMKANNYSVNIPFIEVSMHTGKVVSGIGPMKYLTR